MFPQLNPEEALTPHGRTWKTLLQLLPELSMHYAWLPSPVIFTGVTSPASAPAPPVPEAPTPECPGESQVGSARAGSNREG